MQPGVTHGRQHSRSSGKHALHPDKRHNPPACPSANNTSRAALNSLAGQRGSLAAQINCTGACTRRKKKNGDRSRQSLEFLCGSPMFSISQCCKSWRELACEVNQFRKGTTAEPHAQQFWILRQARHRQITAMAASGDSYPVRIGQTFLDQVIYPRRHIHGITTAHIVTVGKLPLPAIPAGTAIIGRQAPPSPGSPGAT